MYVCICNLHLCGSFILAYCGVALRRSVPISSRFLGLRERMVPSSQSCKCLKVWWLGDSSVGTVGGIFRWYCLRGRIIGKLCEYNAYRRCVQANLQREDATRMLIVWRETVGASLRGV